MDNYYKFKKVYELFLNGQYTEAHELLIELQSEYIKIHNENNILRLQLHDTQDALFFSENLYFDGEYYWFNHINGKQGPFCRHCYEMKGILSYIINKNSKTCSTCGNSTKRNNALPLTKKNNYKKVIPFPKKTSK